MTLDLAQIGVEVPGPTFHWTARDCIVYALAVGASASGEDRDLAFTTETNELRAQRVLPTMAVVISPGSGPGTLEALGDFHLSAVLHAGQQVRFHRELPVDGVVRTTSTLEAVYDKGRAALAVYSTRAALLDGEPLFDRRSFVMIRGEGGFGGERGPASASGAIPDTPPDGASTFRTSASQALLYRLTGDRNPLHSEPRVAQQAGFDRPILHGLCTYGIAGRIVLDSLCAGDPSRMRSIDAKFSSPVVPGEALTVEHWTLSDSTAAMRVRGEDGRVVLDQGFVEFDRSSRAAAAPQEEART